MATKTVTNTSGVKLRVLQVTDRNKKTVEQFVGGNGEVEITETFVKKTGDTRRNTKVRLKTRKGVRVAVEGDYIAKRGKDDFVVVKAADSYRHLGL